jgi:hypothetical protein
MIGTPTCTSDWHSPAIRSLLMEAERLVTEARQQRAEIERLRKAMVAALAWIDQGERGAAGNVLRAALTPEDKS